MAKVSIVDILLIILFLLAVYFILTRLFGHSASDLAISVTLFTLVGGMLYKLNREFGEFKIRVINTFSRLKEDVNEIKEAVTETKIRRK